MIRRIVLENYMSHSRTAIEPAAGLTVLAGPNNCGKSAVVSALQTLCGDNRGDFMVRHGAKQCSVTVETDDGHVIVWRRKGGSISYVMDGTEVHRSGPTNLPDNLHEHLRLAKVEPADGKDAFDLHFGVQKSPIFLIDSESQAASFFSASNDAERLLDLQRKHKGKWQDAQREERRLKAESAAAELKLAALAPLKEVDAAIADAEKRHANLVRLSAGIRGLGVIIGKLERAERDAARLEGRAKALADVKSPPTLLDVGRVELLLRQLVETGRVAEEARQRRDAVSPLKTPPAVRETGPLAERVKKWARAMRTIRALEARRDKLADLREAPALGDAEGLRKLSARLDRKTREFRECTRKKAQLDTLRIPPERRDTITLASILERLGVAEPAGRAVQARARTLSHLKAPPLPADPQPLRKLIDQFGAPQRGFDGARAEVERINRELAGVEGRIDEWVSAHPMCPVCGGATERAKILAGEHGHE